jgi:hypothetical protein
VFVLLFEACFVHVHMGMRLPTMTVFMIMFHMFMIMQEVRVRMGYIAVGVLVSVLRCHLCPLVILVRSRFREVPKYVTLYRPQN